MDIFRKPLPGVGILSKQTGHDERMKQLREDLSSSREVVQMLASPAFKRYRQAYEAQITALDGQIRSLARNAKKNADQLQRLSDLRDAMAAVIGVADQVTEKLNKQAETYRTAEYRKGELAKRNRT